MMFGERCGMRGAQKVRQHFLGLNGVRPKKRRRG